MADRNEKGRFLPGNRAAKGNPYARHVAKLRAALMRAVTPLDVQEIIDSLVRAAKAGDINAARIILERTLGKPLEADIIERLETLESAIEGQKHHGNN